ncbi:hypothetical protein EV401DRAFT_2261188 [Pisolithus croceorrhizus]|nr:hypothetical protein EV401DRAFT_2261188 [Pisolithus croceorrhizus]
MSLKTIAVMGPTGSGKSTFINSLVPPGSTSGTRVGHSLRSETNKIQPVELDNGNGLSFKLVDTPGFDDSREGITDIDVLSMIAAFIRQEEEHSMLAGLIYMHRISDTRMGGTARRNLRVFHKLCGQDSLKNVVVVTTMWDKVTLEEGERRERELQSSETLFKPLLDEGAVMCRHDGTPASALGIIDYLLRIQDHATTQIVHELLYDQKTLENTAAGTEIQSELRAILQKHSADIKSLEEEMRSATTASAKDEIAVQKRELELSADKLNKQIQDLKRRSGANETFQPAREHTTHPVSFQSPPRSSSFDLSRYPSRAIEIHAPHDFRGYSYHRNDLMWGRSPPLPTNSLPVPQADYIANCTELLHLANRVPKIHKMAPTRDDILSHTSAWTLNFASVIGKSVDSAQHGIVTLEAMTHLQNQRQPQDLASHFLDTTKDIERDWRDACTTMAKTCGEYRAVLRAEQRTTLTTRVFGGGKRYFNILQAITGIMRLVLFDLNSTIEWWANISDRVGTWGDIANQPMSRYGFDDRLRGEVSAVIRALTSYRKAYQNVSQELRESIESVESDPSYCKVDGIQAALLSKTDHQTAVTPYRAKLRRNHYPHSEPSLFGRERVPATVPNSSIDMMTS